MTNAEIQVGEYVRTKKHGIFKVAEIHKTEYGYYVLSTDTFEVFTIGKGFSHEIKNDITKHSFNLIDLIEVGDYVNGEHIEHIEINNGKKKLDYTYECCFTSKKEIKTIVTKEQFEAMEYKVGGEDD